MWQHFCCTKCTLSLWQWAPVCWWYLLLSLEEFIYFLWISLQLMCQPYLQFDADVCYNVPGLPGYTCIKVTDASLTHTLNYLEFTIVVLKSWLNFNDLLTLPCQILTNVHKWCSTAFFNSGAASSHFHYLYMVYRISLRWPLTIDVLLYP